MNIKKTAWIVLGGLLLLLVFTPQLLSTSPGKRIFIHLLEKQTKSSVSVDHIQLSWTGPQVFSNLLFQSKQCKGSLKEMRVGVRFWSLFPLFELQNLNAVNGDASISDAAFQFESEQFDAVRLESIQGVIRFHEGGADFTADGKTVQNDKNGSYTVHGQLYNINQGFPEFSVHGECHSFPLLPIARLISLRRQVDENVIMQILGGSLDLQGSASYRNNEGFFELSLHTANIDSSIQGKMMDRRLTLSAPLTAVLQLTPEFSQWILRDVNPLLVTGVEAKSPIRLRIEPGQFQCSIPFRLEDLQIGQGMLDLGQLRCFNGGSLSSLLRLLKMDPFSANQQMDVWFTPLFFSLRQGVLKTSRVDFLMDRKIHLCSWGSIDYLHRQLDMFVGLPAETLQQLFGIEKLPQEYVMKVALSGTIQKPKLATHAAATKIAALLTAQKSNRSWLSTGVRNLFGETDTSVPSPQHPFPWEK